MDDFGSFVYFCSEYRRFRELIGLRSTWQDIDRPLLAFRGLLYVGANTTERTDLVSQALEAADVEMGRRIALSSVVLMSKLDDE